MKEGFGILNTSAILEVSVVNLCINTPDELASIHSFFNFKIARPESSCILVKASR